MPDNKFANSFAAIRQASPPDEASEGGASADGGAEGVAPSVAIPVVTRTRTVQSVRPDAPRGTVRSTARTDARTTAPAVPPERRGPGRPPGKRSDPEYRQVTGLIRKDVHVAVLKQMLDEGRSRDMGALLQELLERHYLKPRRHNVSTS